MINGSSAELQELALQGLLSDPYLLSKCVNVINESYFENKSYKLIYKSLKSYYNKFLSIPNSKDLFITIQDNFEERYGDLEEIRNCLSELYEGIGDKNIDFVYDKVTDFIRRNNIEKSINNIVEYVKSGSVDLDKIAVQLKESLDINFSKSTIYNLSDVNKINEIKEEALGPSENPVIIKFFIDSINSCMQYRGLIPGTINMIVAPPGRGKTTTAINQGLYTAQQGYNVLHVFLGDMSRYDGLLRYLSCLSGVDTSKLVDFSNEDLVAFIKKYNMTGVLGYISILSYAADEKTPDQLIEEIKDLQRENKVHYDCIIIDYDENFAKENDSMYESGGNVYNRIALFSVLNKSVIFILAQPKPAYWNRETIPLEAAAESSKKQKIIDTMLTIGSLSKSSKVGTLHIAKNRRGEDGRSIRIEKNGNNARIEAITNDQYERILNSEKYQKEDIGTEE